MNILFDGTVFEIPFTGVAKSALCLYKKYLELNKATDFTGFIKDKPFSTLPKGIELIKLQKYFYERLYSKNTINRIIKKIKPDVIHFPWSGNIPCKFKRVITVMTLHDVLPLEIPNYFYSARKEKEYINKVQKDIDRADLIFTDSNYSKQQIKKNFKVKNNIIVNYLASPLHTINESDCKKPDFEYFIYVGGYAARKGLDSLVKAFISLHKNGKSKTKLLFTGIPKPLNSDFNALMEKGKKIGIIEERGYVVDEELAFLLSNSIGLLYLSKHEGFGLPPLEAMSLGCPVVTTKFSSIPEICGNSAIYVDPDNINEITQAMEKLEKNMDLRSEFKEKGLVQASLFSWEKTANNYKKYLSEYTK